RGPRQRESPGSRLRSTPRSAAEDARVVRHGRHRMNDVVVTRRPPFGATSWNPDARTFDAVLSAGTAVERYDARGLYLEMLSLEGAAFPGAIPLLDSHQRDSVDSKLGEVDNIQAVGGKLLGRATLSRHNPRSNRIAAELSDGNSFGVSIGYIVRKWNERQNTETGRREKIAVAFDLVECSLVVLPADQHAGIRQMTVEPTPAATPETLPPAAVDRAAVNSEIRSIARVSGLDQT